MWSKIWEDGVAKVSPTDQTKAGSDARFALLFYCNQRLTLRGGRGIIINLSGGPRDALMHAFMKISSCKYAVFDMAKSNEEKFWPWGFMESLKNGGFTATKYQGGTCNFDPIKVVVFSNEDPPRDKLSADRYDIFRINNGLF